MHNLLILTKPLRKALLDTTRIPALTVRIDGQPNPVPQKFYDAMAVDSANSNTHPHMGPFTHTAIADGLWSDPTIWNTGTVPGENAVVNTTTKIVTYDLESDVKVNDIHVSDFCEHRSPRWRPGSGRRTMGLAGRICPDPPDRVYFSLVKIAFRTGTTVEGHFIDPQEPPITPIVDRDWPSRDPPRGRL